MTVAQKIQLKSHYEILGLENDPSSSLIWLIHGAGGDLKHFKNVAPILVSNGFRVLLMDVRYHGLSQPMDPDMDLGNVSFKFSDIIEDMNALLEEIKATYYNNHAHPIPLFLGGLSMGGMITLLYTASLEHSFEMHGFLLRGNILMASAIPLMEMERPGWELYRDRSATSEVFETTKASIIASAVSEAGRKETARAMALVNNHVLYECFVEIATYLPVPTDPPHPYEPASELPVLLVLPDHDIYTKTEMEELYKINRERGITSKLVNVEHAGHMVILDRGEIVAENIIKFCNSILSFFIEIKQ